MTEAEWLACGDPAKMLELLRGKASDRKTRVLACACVRRVWHLFSDDRLRDAIQVCECHVDDVATEAQRRQAISAAHQACRKRDHLAKTAYEVSRLQEDFRPAGNTCEAAGWWIWCSWKE